MFYSGKCLCEKCVFSFLIAVSKEYSYAKSGHMMVHDTWRNFINQFPEAELLVDCKSDAHTMTDVKFDSKDGVDNSIESKFTINDQLIVLKVLRAVSGGSAWKQINHVCHTGDSYNFSTPNVPSYALAA